MLKEEGKNIFQSFLKISNLCTYLHFLKNYSVEFIPLFTIAYSPCSNLRFTHVLDHHIYATISHNQTYN